MASSENGATTLFDNVTPLLTPVGNSVPISNYSQNSITHSSSINLFDSSSKGETALVLSQSRYPDQPVTFTFYLMRGYYVAGAVNEYWVVSGSPGVTPPSGHSLTNIVILETWQSTQ